MSLRPARLAGTITVPANKSVAQRALIASALAGQRLTDPPQLRIENPGADIVSTAHAMADLGALSIDVLTDDLLVATCYGAPETLGAPDAPLVLDCGNSGTGMRLLMGALAGLLADREGAVTLTGDSSLSSRPMERVAAPLREMGARIETSKGTAPVTITGPAPLHPIDIELPVPSAQVLAALCFAALAAPGTTRITLPGPSRDHTERFFAFCGVDIRREGAPQTRTTITGPARLALREFSVPGDESSAAFWLVAATIHPDADLTLPAVGLNPTRTALIATLRHMGADITVTPDDTTGPEPSGTIEVRSAPLLSPITIAGAETADLIDELPILALAMAGAGGTSELRDAAEMRVKESDRIALTCAMLTAAGIDVTETPDGWRITGSPRRYPSADAPPVTIRTDGDHRIAMAAAILTASQLAPRAIIADDPHCAAVSYPGFAADLAAVTERRDAPQQ